MTMMKNKIVIINRAISASGKTTLAQAIKQQAEQSNLLVDIHSTDSYFLNAKGEYIFDAEKLDEYHQQNQQSFEKSLKNEVDIVICDNTNLKPWEAERYTELARRYNYFIVLLNFFPRGIDQHIEAQKSAEGNVSAHQVPREKLGMMLMDFYSYSYFSRQRDWQGNSNKETGGGDYDDIIAIYPEMFFEAKVEVPKKIVDLALHNPPLYLATKRWLKALDNNGYEAQAFYFDEVLPKVIDAQDVANLQNEQCDVLISLMGFSPETTVISASLLKPKRLIVITGDNTEKNYDLAAEFLLDRKILRPSQMQVRSIDITNVSEIYKIIEERAGEQNVFVDITGGKKIMSAAAAQAAWEINATLCYIEGVYNPEIRRPEPGTEKLIFLDNPSLEKAKIQRQRGVEAWKQRNFAQAKNFFEESKKLNKKHLFEDIAIPLCQFYTYLYDFNFTDMEAVLSEFEEIVETDYMKELSDGIQLGKLTAFFRQDMNIEKTQNRIALFLSMAHEYALLGRYDFAGLLSYRAVEALIELELSNCSSSGFFDTSDPQYDLIADERSNLEELFSQIWMKVNKNKESRKLPAKVGLADGFSLLLLLKEAKFSNIFGEKTKEAIGVLNKLRGICSSRNNSILAHGYATLGKEKYSEIHNLALILASLISNSQIQDLIAIVTPPDILRYVSYGNPSKNRY